MSLANQSQQPTPWYRVSIVWLLIATPTLAVIVGIMMLTISIKTFDGLVVDDYYRHGKEINKVLARDEFSAAHNVTVTIGFEFGAGRITLAVRGDQPALASKDLKLTFIHPTVSGKDLVLSLTGASINALTAPLPDLSPGRWILQVETSDWRLQDSIQWPPNRQVTLTAGGAQ